MRWIVTILSGLGGSAIAVAIAFDLIRVPGWRPTKLQSIFLCVLSFSMLLGTFYSWMKWGDNYHDIWDQNAVALAQKTCIVLSWLDDDLAMCKLSTSANELPPPKIDKPLAAHTFSKSMPIIVVGGSGEYDVRVVETLRSRLAIAGFHVVQSLGEASVVLSSSVGTVDAGTKDWNWSRAESVSNARVLVAANWKTDSSPLMVPRTFEGIARVPSGKGDSELAALSDAVNKVVAQLEALAGEGKK